MNTDRGRNLKVAPQGVSNKDFIRYKVSNRFGLFRGSKQLIIIRSLNPGLGVRILFFRCAFDVCMNAEKPNSGIRGQVA